MSEIPDTSKPEFIPETDAVHAVERIIHAYRELHAAKEALIGLPPEALLAAYVLALHVNEVGYRIDSTDERSDPNRRTIIAASEDAWSTARYAIRRNATGGIMDEIKCRSHEGLDKEILELAIVASSDADSFAHRFSPGDAAKSVYHE